MGLCAASVLAAMGVGLLLARTAEGLLGRLRRDRAGVERSDDEP